MAMIAIPPLNVGPISVIQFTGNPSRGDFGKLTTVNWPYFIYDNFGRRAHRRQVLPDDIYTKIYKRPASDRNDLDHTQSSNEHMILGVLTNKIQQYRNSIPSNGSGCYVAYYESSEATMERSVPEAIAKWTSLLGYHVPNLAEFAAGERAYLAANPWYSNPALKCIPTIKNSPFPPTPTLIPEVPTKPSTPVVTAPPSPTDNPIVNILPVVDYKDPYIPPVQTTPTKPEPYTPEVVPPPKPTPTVKLAGTTVTIPFFTTASFKPGTSAAANARGKTAFIALVKKASVASKLTKEQAAQLMSAVIKAIDAALLAKKNSLARLKPPPVVTKTPIKKLNQ
jgi:hypothetical protein